jgi:O-methyltransferase
VIPQVQSGKQDTGLVRRGDIMDTSVEYAINYPSPVMCSLRKANHSKLLSDILDANISGDIIEIGSYTGEGSTMVIASVMNKYATDKTLHLYDSFQGLSKFHEFDKTEYDVFEGMFSTPQNILESNLSHYNIKKNIYSGWISEVLPDSIPNKICYAHIDCDLYDPILFSLNAIYNTLTPGAICIIDDYNWPPFPGATKAVDEFMSNKPEKLLVLPDTIHAYFTKE